MNNRQIRRLVSVLLPSAALLFAVVLPATLNATQNDSSQDDWYVDNWKSDAKDIFQNWSEDESLSVETGYACYDHVARSGQRVHRCWGRISVEHIGHADTLTVRAIDGISYQSAAWVVPEEEIGSFVFADTVGDGELQYRDHVVVSARYPNGSVVEVERHEFTCRDVYYTDACNESSGGEFR